MLESSSLDPSIYRTYIFYVSGDDYIRLLLLCLSVRDDEDEHQRADEQQSRIEQVRQNLECGDIDIQSCGGRNRYEHLCAVGKCALNNTGEGIEQGCGLAGGNAVVLGHLMCDRVCHDDCDRVVSSCNIHQGNENTHAELTAALALEDTADAVEQSVEAAVFTDKSAQCGNENSDHCSFEHTCAAGAHGAQEINKVGRARCKHDDNAGNDADEQDDKYVDADNAADEDEHIGDDAEQIIFAGNGSRKLCTQRQDQNQNEGHDCSGKCDKDVFAEFGLHGAALTVAGCDGGIGDKGKVIAEHCTADNRADAKRHSEAGSVRNGNCDGSNQGDGTDGGAHCQRNKAADAEENNDAIACGNQREGEVGNAFCTAASDNTDKNTGGDEDQDHGENVLVTDALAHDGKLFVKLHLAVLQTGYQNGKHESNDNGNIVESHGDFHNVLKGNTNAEVCNKEYTDRQ